MVVFTNSWAMTPLHQKIQVLSSDPWWLMDNRRVSTSRFVQADHSLSLQLSQRCIKTMQLLSVTWAPMWQSLDTPMLRRSRYSTLSASIHRFCCGMQPSIQKPRPLLMLLKQSRLFMFTVTQPGCVISKRRDLSKQIKLIQTTKATYCSLQKMLHTKASQHQSRTNMQILKAVQSQPATNSFMMQAGTHTHKTWPFEKIDSKNCVLASKKLFQFFNKHNLTTLPIQPEQTRLFFRPSPLTTAGGHNQKVTLLMALHPKKIWASSATARHQHLAI